MLLDNHIALFDVLKSCNIKGSSDNSINCPQVNDFNEIFNGAHIARVYTNGKVAYNYYTKYIGEAVYLPSTSPANATFKLDDLITCWSIILKDLNA